jgi:hypothetical protein
LGGTEVFRDAGEVCPAGSRARQRQTLAY